MYVISAEFFLQLIGSAFMSTLPLFMRIEHYTDGQVADATKFRYLGVLATALLVGAYIRGRKLKNLFFISAFFVPASALAVIYTIQLHSVNLNHFAQLLWGASFTFMQIPVLPFILRNSEKQDHTSAISLSYATWSIATILSSALIALLNKIDPLLFSEKNLLYLIAFSGFISVLLIARVKLDEFVPDVTSAKTVTRKKDVVVIIRALIPTLIIAVGAGFTIPFISLFFVNVHKMTTSGFNAVNLVASLFVAFSALMVPHIKRSIGYKLAIPATQSFAIIALVLMATTQFYAELNVAVYIAIGCFLLRQPLMNMAGPMTTEVTMNYVGKRNREIVSALSAAIWSGSWFFSGMIFGELRDRKVDYVNIFMITAGLYTIGVVWYFFLIRDHEKREKERKARKEMIRNKSD